MQDVSRADSCSMEDFAFRPLTVSAHFVVLIKQRTDQSEGHPGRPRTAWRQLVSLSVGLKTPARHRPVSFASFRAGEARSCFRSLVLIVSDTFSSQTVLEARVFVLVCPAARRETRPFVMRGSVFRCVYLPQGHMASPNETAFMLSLVTDVWLKDLNR